MCLPLSHLRLVAVSATGQYHARSQALRFTNPLSLPGAAKTISVMGRIRRGKEATTLRTPREKQSLAGQDLPPTNQYRSRPESPAQTLRAKIQHISQLGCERVYFSRIASLCYRYQPVCFLIVFLNTLPLYMSLQAVFDRHRARSTVA